MNSSVSYFDIYSTLYSKKLQRIPWYSTSPNTLWYHFTLIYTMVLNDNHIHIASYYHVHWSCHGPIHIISLDFKNTMVLPWYMFKTMVLPWYFNICHRNKLYHIQIPWYYHAACSKTIVLWYTIVLNNSYSMYLQSSPNTLTNTLAY